MPSKASAETIALDTNSLCASVNVSSSSSNELNAIILFKGVLSSCEMLATKARCSCETLSASIFAFSRVRAANCEYRETSSASVNNRSSNRISPSAALISQKFEKTNMVLYVIFATISANVISMNCVTVSINLNSLNSWMMGNSVHVAYVMASRDRNVNRSSGCCTRLITCVNRLLNPFMIIMNRKHEMTMETTRT